MPIKKKTMSKSKPKSNTIKVGGLKSSSSGTSSPKTKNKDKKSGGTSPQKQQGVTLKTSPKKISDMPDDALLKILAFVNKSKFSDTLDKNLIFDYLDHMPKISKTNKGLKNLVTMTQPWDKIKIINLEDLEITTEILDVLKKTNMKNIERISLQNITFDSGCRLVEGVMHKDETCKDKTRNDFLEFFSKNTMVKFLILNKIDVEAVRFFTILQKFKSLKWLEINKFKLNESDHPEFIKVLVSLNLLEYLTLKENTLHRAFITYLFTANEINQLYVGSKKYIIYTTRDDAKSGKKLKLVIEDGEGTQLKNIPINIVDNTVLGERWPFHFPNNFGRIY